MTATTAGGEGTPRRPHELRLAPGAPTLIEASAGTGKTWQLSDMVLRLVVDHGVAAEELLVITFTKAATAELRQRVRGRLAAARRVLRREEQPEAGDLTMARLAALPQEGRGGEELTRDRALRRISAALSGFDQLTISTIHGFCQSTLTRFTFEAGRGEVTDVAKDALDLLDELVRDTLQALYVRGTRAGAEILPAMGLTYENLYNLGREMLLAQAPLLVVGDGPPVGCREAVDAAGFDPLAAAAEIAPLEAAFRAWWASDEAEACREAFKVRGTFSAGFGKSDMEKLFKRVEEWAQPGATATWTKKMVDSGVHPDGQPYEGEPKLRRIVVETRLQKAHRDSFGGWPLLERFEALYTARQAWRRRVVPQAQAWFACRVREGIHGVLRRKGRLTYPTMLSDLAEALTQQGPEGPLARAMRARHKAALVDEFQDTDGAQWRILRTAFAQPEARLVLVGDPKQAIYGFRGADLGTYLEAAKDAVEQGFLERNYRADGPMVAAVNHLFGPPRWGDDPAQGAAGEAAGEAFGAASLRFRPVEAQHPEARWKPGGATRRALELRWVDVNELAGGPPGGKRDKGSGGKLWPVVAEACAQEIAGLLQQDPPVELWEPGEEGEARAEDGSPGASASPAARRRRLRPGDIAVLVHTHKQGAAVRQLLRRRGVPSVAVERRSVFQSQVATWLLDWLDAVADPTDERRARAAAATPLFGWTAQDLGLAMEAREEAREETDRETSTGEGAAQRPARDPASLVALKRWEAWLGALKEAADKWSSRGFARTLERALEAGVPAWIGQGAASRAAEGPTDPAPCPPPPSTAPRAGLARQEAVSVSGAAATLFGADGARHATDLRHLAEVLQAEERTRRVGPRGLALWLRERIHEAASGEADDERTIRLETDAEAVQVATLHASKGLEYGVVMLPTVGLAGSHPDKDMFVGFRGKEGRVLDLRPREDPGRKRSLEASREAQVAEQARLLYVGLTRAKHHAVVWLLNTDHWASVPVEHSPLGRLLFARVGVGAKTALPADAPADAQTAYEAGLARVAESSGGTVGWSVQRSPRFTRYIPDREEALALETAPWPADRVLGGVWRVSSFSGLSKGRDVQEEEPERPEQWVAAQATAAGTAEEADGGEEIQPTITHGAAEPPDEVPGAKQGGWAAPLAFEGLRGGIDTGHWIHAVFEHLDFQTKCAKSGESLEALVEHLGLKYGVRDERRHQLVAQGLPGVLETPLDGGVTGLPAGTCLAKVARADRMDELRFDLRLGAGSRWSYGDPSRDVRVDYQLAREALEKAARSSTLGAAPWLKGVLAKLREAAQDPKRHGHGPTLFPRMAGIMTGSIDLAFRVRSSHGGGGDGPRDQDLRKQEHPYRYYVADYKTNLIAPPGARRTAKLGNYNRAWMGWEMAQHAYHLQALIYTTALHRMLRLRLGAGYDYDRHMGGHLYLFVRGMVGDEAPRDKAPGDKELAAGVWADRWPREVVEAVDRAFDGSPRRDLRGEGPSAGQGGSAS